MPKTKVYEPEFKKKIVRLYLEEGRTIKSLNEEYQLGILRNFMKRTRNYGRNWNNRKKEIASLKKAAAFSAKVTDQTNTSLLTNISRS